MDKLTSCILNLSSYAEKFCNLIHTFFRKKNLMMSYKYKMINNLQKLNTIRKLTKSQKKEIQSYYKGLIGKKVSLYSHEYFYSRTGIFSKRYVPTDLYYSELIAKANKANVQVVYCDKNVLDVFLPKDKVPHVYLKNMNGYFYFEGNPVTQTEAIKRCSNIGAVILKPSISSQGKGIRKLVLKEGVDEQTNQTIDQIFVKYKNDYTIEECIIQHERMAALNPTSVNTIRILTYRSDYEVLVVYAVIRIGRFGSLVDNQSAGGISVSIDKEGKLNKYAIAGATTDGVEKTDTGVVLDGYEIPSYFEAIELVKQFHTHFPYSKILGWDIAIKENGDPILLEVNTTPGLSQSALGSGFGEYTDKIIKELWVRPNTKFR